MTGLPDQALTALMYAETDSAPPPMVDLARVMKDGRRRRFRRRLLPPAVASVMIVALAVGVLAVRGVPMASPPVAPAATATSPSMSRMKSAPATFNPLRQSVVAGWVPDGLIQQPPILSQMAQRIWYSERPPEGGNPQGHWVDVTVYAAGVRPWQLNSEPMPQPAIVPVDPVNGAPAQRLVYEHSGYPDAFAWKWASDAWAVVRVDIGNGSDQQAMERRIAQNVRTDADQPLSLPFTVATPPAPLRLVMVDIEEAGPWFSAMLRFGLHDAVDVDFPIRTQSGTTHNYYTLWVSVTRDLPGARRKPEADRTLGGYPAAVWGFNGQGYGGNVVLYDVGGYQVNVMVMAEGLPLVGRDKAIELALSVAVLSLPTNRSDWIANPLR
jgi:hypothetical protein